MCFTVAVIICKSRAPDLLRELELHPVTKTFSSLAHNFSVASCKNQNKIHTDTIWGSEALVNFIYDDLLWIALTKQDSLQTWSSGMDEY